MDLSVSNEAKSKVSSAIFISGTARSGTTILYKLINSFKGVEGCFEPPTLFSLFKNGDFYKHKLLYETYLYEDFFLNSISGRNINCNVNDDSSIYHVKTQKEIERRLSGENRKLDIERATKESVICYKMPDMLSMFATLRHYYPDMKLVLIERDPVSTMNSLLKKGWFSDEGLKSNSYLPIYHYKGFNIPFFVLEEDFDLWVGLSEVDRCAYYYLVMNEVSVPDDTIRIHYEKLITDPISICHKLSELLNLELGEKSEAIVSTISFQEKERDYNIIDMIGNNDIKNRISNYKL